MFKKVKMIGLEGILVCLLPIIHQVVNIAGLSGNFMYLPLLLIVYLHCRRLIFPESYEILGAAYVVSYFFCTVLSGEITLYALQYIFLIGAFYLAIPLMGMKIGAHYEECIGLMVLAGAIILIPKVLPQMGNISVDQIKSAMKIEAAKSVRNRLSFGFSHPNTAAYFLATEILLLNAYIRKKSRGINRAAACAAILLFGVALLGTGSRTAAISVFVLFMIQLFLAAAKRFLKVKSNFYPLCILTGIGVLFGSGAMDSIWGNSSGRDSAAENLLASLISNHRLLFGTGVSGISSGNISKVLGEKIIIDGWYMHMFATTGVVGVTVILAGIGILFFKLLKKIPESNEKDFVFSVMVFLLCYGFAENVVFVPGVLLSVVCWVLIMALYFKTAVESHENFSI